MARITSPSGGALADGTVTDAKIVAGGLSPTTVTGTAVVTADSRLADSRAPSGAAGGDLTGTYPNPTIGSGKVTSTAILDGTIVAGDIADLAITARKASDLLRTGGWMPTGAIDQTVPDRIAASSLTITSGTVYVFGGIVIPGGRTVTSVSFMSHTQAAVSPTNWWFGISDPATTNVLAITADQTSTAWGSQTVKTVNLASAYTPANAIEVYVFCMVAAGTTPTLKAASMNTNLAAVAPVMCGSGNTGYTTPATVGSALGSATSVNANAYAWVA